MYPLLLSLAKYNIMARYVLFVIQGFHWQHVWQLPF